MTTEMRHFCDRCCSIILEARTLLGVETGPLRPKRPEVDLCARCAEAFDNWLAAGAATIPADIEAPAEWPPRTERSATAEDLDSGSTAPEGPARR